MTIVTIPTDVHRVQGARWDAAAQRWYDTDVSGRPLFPVVYRAGVRWYDTKPLWPASTAVQAGAQVAPGNGYWYQAQNSGTTGASAPAWGTVIGGTTNDNGVVWENKGLHADSFGLLAEPESTNLLLYSGNMIGNGDPGAPGGWTDNNANSTTYSGEPDPEGGTNGVTWPADANKAIWVCQVADTGTSITGKTFTFSVWLKAGATPATNIQLYLDDGFGPTESGQASATTVATAPSSWTRYSATYTFTASTRTTVRVNIVTSTQTAGQAFVCWGAQLEQRPVATSYIPTTSAAVTRATEALNINWPASGNITDSEGTAVIDIVPQYNHADLGGGYEYILSGTIYEPLTEVFRAYDGTNIADVAATITKDRCYRIAVRWNATTRELQIGYKDVSTFGSSWAWGSVASYDGTITPADGFLRLLGSTLSVAPILYRNLHIHGRDLGTAGVEAYYS